MPIKVQRGGKTSPTWSNDPYDIRLGYFPSDPDDRPGQVYLMFRMPSKGGGTTDVRVEFPLDTFEDLASQMMRANRDAAILAFGKALQIEPFTDENGLPY